MASDAPDSSEPQSFSQKIGAALPIALTAIATAFAGMSTSEMTRAMYWRSAAAQDQSKANDQWTLAGFKRDRSLIVQTTSAQFQSMAGFRAVASPGEHKPTATPEIVDRIGKWLAGKGEPPVADPAIGSALTAVREKKSEEELVRIARNLSFEEIQKSITAAETQSLEVEKAWDSEVDRLAKVAKEAMAVAAKSPGDAKAIADANLAQAARYEVDYRRYRAESTMNLWVGFFFEVRVKKSTSDSDRHRTRSENFFYAMLAAQAGATVASLGLARKQQSALWLVAGVSGLIAVGFGTWVYLTM